MDKDEIVQAEYRPQDHSTKMILRPFSSGAAIRSIACPAAFSLIPSTIPVPPDILMPSDLRQLQQPVQIPVIFYGMGRAPCQQRLPVLHGLHADHSGSSRPAGRLDYLLGILKHHTFLRPEPQKLCRIQVNILLRLSLHGPVI